MTHTPGTATLLRQLRREQGRPLRENGADIGIHRDRETVLRSTGSPTPVTPQHRTAARGAER